ncbi:MAG: glycosyltransferase family 2 protein [Gemmatimonadales bacterium]
MSASTSSDVAVVVPTFNRLDLLKETVASLQNQTMRSARFIMVDDRSDEPTRQYLASLSDADSRFVFIAKPDEFAPGCQVSRNIGLDACNATAIVFLDSDDLLESSALENRYKVLSSNPGTEIVVGWQSIRTDDGTPDVWVNVPKSGVPDIDRFLELTHPIDVPWVNGGVMIRTESLRSSSVRWRPEFDWDDVAFHFECLVYGLRPVWMDFNGRPDSIYRAHSGPRYGSMLATEQGIRSAARMIGWMYDEIVKHQLTGTTRVDALRRALFRACILPSLDAGNISAARALIRDAQARGLLSARDAKKLSTYASGRDMLSISDRATFYWNRFSDRRLLADFLTTGSSTYSTMAVNPAPPTIT